MEKITGTTYRAAFQFSLVGLLSLILAAVAAAQHPLTVNPDVNEPFLLLQTYSHGPLVDVGAGMTDMHVVNDTERPWIVMLNFSGIKGLYEASLEVSGSIRHKPQDGEINLGPLFTMTHFRFSTTPFRLGDGGSTTAGPYPLIDYGARGVHDQITGHVDVIDYVELFVKVSEGIRGANDENRFIEHTIEGYELRIKARHVPEPAGVPLMALGGLGLAALGRRGRGGREDN